MNTNKILVVEDDNTLLLAYTSVLSKEGFTVVPALDSHEALDQFAKNNVAAIIMDFMLPSIHGMNGIEVLREIRNNPKGKDIPAFVVTNLDDVNLREESKKVNAEYILKVNSSLSDIANKIKEVIK